MSVAPGQPSPVQDDSTLRRGGENTAPTRATRGGTEPWPRIPRVYSLVLVDEKSRRNPLGVEPERVHREKRDPAIENDEVLDQDPAVEDPAA